MDIQNSQDQLPHGLSLDITEDEKIKHEGGHVILHWLIGNKPVSVEYTANGLITNLEQIINTDEQPWQHIMALLAGYMAENNNEILLEVSEIINDMKYACNQYFANDSDSFRVFNYLLNIDGSLLWTCAMASSNILDLCQDLLDDFVMRFKEENRLNSEEIQEMFASWDNTKNWSKEEKLNILKTKFEEMRGISPY